MSSVTNMGTAKRTRRKSKHHKSESEEYDSLGSDTESGSGEHGTSSRTESSNHLEDSGPPSFSKCFCKSLNQKRNKFKKVFIYFPAHAHSPGSRAGKERLTLFTKSTLHSKLVLFCGIF